MSPHPDVQAFAKVPREIGLKPRQHDQMHWAGQVARCLANVERSDAFGIQRFLSLFGGMGSLNDILLVANGTLLREENDRLRALLSRAYDTARHLERDGQGKDGVTDPAAC